MEKRGSGLTPKQKEFADCVVKGMTLADAYREAYNANRMQDNSIYREASLLMADPKITQRVEELQRQKDRALLASSIADRDIVLRFLRDVVLDEEERTADRLRSAELLGKTTGLYKDVIETQQDTRSPDEIWQELEGKLADLFKEAASATKQ